MRKSEEIKRNFFNKKASDIHKYFPGNWNRPNEEVPYIRDGLQSTYAPKKKSLNFLFLHSELKIEKLYNKNVFKARDCRNAKW